MICWGCRARGSPATTPYSLQLATSEQDGKGHHHHHQHCHVDSGFMKHWELFPWKQHFPMGSTSQ